MKNTVKPKNQERKMRDTDFIVSKTNTKGIITYANNIFYEFSAYNEQQSLGKQHNLIRHPDMPRGTFQLLWDTINQGNEFNAYVKNMSQDGSFYWVFANITPSFDQDNKIRGYFSVRRKPSQSAVNIISPIYQEMLALEKKSQKKDATATSIQFLSDKLKSLGTSYEQFVLSI